MVKNKGRSKLYPAVSMAASFELCEKAGRYPVKRPVAYSAIAGDYGLKSANTKSLMYRISAAKQLGLIITGGKTFTLTDWGDIVAHPTSEAEVDDIKKKCFGEPPLYKELIDKYNGRSLPDQSSLENLLVREHGIMESVKVTAASVFLGMAKEAEVNISGVLTFDIDESVEENISKVPESTDNLSEEPTTIENEEFSPGTVKNESEYEPLVVPLGNQRKAMLYMPTDSTKEDADYVKAMIETMFSRLYTPKED